MTPTPVTPPPEGCISCEVLDEHILLIGINRPAKRNGWTPRMFRELAEAYTRLDDDPQLRVGVLHAYGDHFTAGLDLPAVVEYLQRDMPYREIPRLTGVSVTTIGRVARYVNAGNGGYATAVSRLKNRAHG